MRLMPTFFTNYTQTGSMRFLVRSTTRFIWEVFDKIHYVHWLCLYSIVRIGIIIYFTFFIVWQICDLQRLTFIFRWVLMSPTLIFAT